MKLTQKTFICIMLIVAALVMGCAKPPTEEMNNATEAVTRAENDNDALTYALNTVNRARDALARMNAEASSKKYDAAKSYAAEAIAAAERAINEGHAGAERARSEAFSIISQLPPLIAETEQGINAAQAAGLPLDFDAINKDFQTASDNADKAQQAYVDVNFPEAVNLGQTARAELSAINQQLSTTVMTVTRKK